jgi:hypothetical protein
LEEALRGSRRATRFVWVGALLLSVVLPATALFAPDLWPASLKRSGGVIVLPDVQPFVGEVVAPSGLVQQYSWSVRDFTLGLWFAATLLCALRWVHGYAGARRCWRANGC